MRNLKFLPHRAVCFAAILVRSLKTMIVFHFLMLVVLLLFCKFHHPNFSALNLFNSKPVQEKIAFGDTDIYWKENSIEIEAGSMKEFRDFLNDRKNYTAWLENCIIASPLKKYNDEDTIGYFGLLYNSPIMRTYAICFSELKSIHNSKMVLRMKKIDANEPLRRAWEQITNNANEYKGVEISKFEAIWTFYQKNERTFVVTLKVGVKPPFNGFVSFFAKGVFLRFVDEVVNNTLKNVKNRIEAQ